MEYNNILVQRGENIKSIAKMAIQKGQRNRHGNLVVDWALFNKIRSAGLSFIFDLYGEKHPYYKEFDLCLNDTYDSNANTAINIIDNIILEIENGWIKSFKSIVAAEIFSDFMEMAEHLLEKNYKDPAAVIIGGVLEEHLRQLAVSKEIDITSEKDGKIITYKADRLNNELAKAEVYNKLEQKNVTAQLDLRNKAAHGKYSEYDIEHVRLMYQNVLQFINRNPI